MRAFVEQHRAKTADILALCPWCKGLSPRVTITFESAGQVYRLRKRFLDGASAHIERKEGHLWSSFSEGDSAEEFLREVIRTEADNPRCSKPESWGLSQVLWAPQGDLSLSPLASSVVESIHQSLDAQLSADGKAVEYRLEDEYLKYFSPTLGKLRSGKNAARQLALQAHRDQIADQVESAKKLLEQFETRSGDIAILREHVAGLQSQQNTLASNVEAAAASAETYKVLETKRKERFSAKALAETQQKAIRDRIDAIDRCRKQVADFEAGVTDIERELPLCRVELNSKQEALAVVGQTRTATINAERDAVAAIETAKLAEEYVRLLGHANDIAKRLGSIANSGLKILGANEKKAGILAPSEQELRELRSLVAVETDCRSKLELARVTVGFVPESAAQIEVLFGEQPGKYSCQSGIPMQLAGSPNLDLVLASGASK